MDDMTAFAKKGGDENDVGEDVRSPSTSSLTYPGDLKVDEIEHMTTVLPEPKDVFAFPFEEDSDTRSDIVLNAVWDLSDDSVFSRTQSLQEQQQEEEVEGLDRFHETEKSVELEKVEDASRNIFVSLADVGDDSIDQKHASAGVVWPRAEPTRKSMVRANPRCCLRLQFLRCCLYTGRTAACQDDFESATSFDAAQTKFSL